MTPEGLAARQTLIDAKEGAKGTIPWTCLRTQLPWSPPKVHGSVQSRGCPRLDHAWIEEPDGTVYDPVLDARFAPVAFSRSFHPFVHVRYPQAEVMVEMLRHRHWGPWHEEDGFDAVTPTDGDDQ